MRKVKSSINIKNILIEFHKSVRKCSDMYYWLPIGVGTIIPFLLKGGNMAATTALNAFLTSFIPLFATVLTFYMSWCYNEIRSRHSHTRLGLFRATSMDILMMIPLDALALLLYVCSTVQWFSGCPLMTEEVYWLAFLKDATWNDVITYPFLAAYYAVVVEIFLILMVVCKRVYIIIDGEIKLLTKKCSK